MRESRSFGWLGKTGRGYDVPWIIEVELARRLLGRHSISFAGVGE
jgi:hypothetical protein